MKYQFTFELNIQWQTQNFKDGPTDLPSQLKPASFCHCNASMGARKIIISTGGGGGGGTKEGDYSILTIVSLINSPSSVKYLNGFLFLMRSV